MKSKVSRLIDILVDELQLHPVVFLPETQLYNEFELSHEQVNRIANRISVEFDLSVQWACEKIKNSPLKDLIRDNESENVVAQEA